MLDIAGALCRPGHEKKMEQKATTLWAAHWGDEVAGKDKSCSWWLVHLT
jgi:hypothetical protein